MFSEVDDVLVGVVCLERLSDFIFRDMQLFGKLGKSEEREVGHLECGLRSCDEFNRVTSLLSPRMIKVLYQRC